MTCRNDKLMQLTATFCNLLCNFFCVFTATSTISHETTRALNWNAKCPVIQEWQEPDVNSKSVLGFIASFSHTNWCTGKSAMMLNKHIECYQALSNVGNHFRWSFRFFNRLWIPAWNHHNKNASARSWWSANHIEFHLLSKANKELVPVNLFISEILINN